jgi:hypothetical protein
MHNTLVVEPLGVPVPAAPRPPAPAALWQLWPGVNAPATAEQETRFVARLTELAGDAGAPEGWTRRNVTAVLNALRCGVEVDDLLTRAPGLRPHQLLLAYRELDARRRGSVAAWAAIVRERTIGSVVDHGESAALLVPVFVARLASIAADGDAARVAHVTGELVHEALVVTEAAESCELLLAAETSQSRREELGRRLYDLHVPGLWSNTAFIPPRVGTLVPVRVAALLGER